MELNEIERSEEHEAWLFKETVSLELQLELALCSNERLALQVARLVWVEERLTEHSAWLVNETESLELQEA